MSNDVERQHQITLPNNGTSVNLQVSGLSDSNLEEICNASRAPTMAEVVIPTLHDTKRGDDLATDELIGGWIADLRRDAASGGARSATEVLALAKTATHEVAAVPHPPRVEARSAAVTTTTPRGETLMGKIKNSTTLIAIVAAATLGTAGAAAAQIGSDSGEQSTTVQANSEIESILDIENRGFLMNSDLMSDVIITSSADRDDSSTTAGVDGDIATDIDIDTDSDDSASVESDGSIDLVVSDDDDSAAVESDGSIGIDVSDDDDSASVTGNGSIGIDVSDDDDSIGVEGNGGIDVDLSDSDDSAQITGEAGVSIGASGDDEDATVQADAGVDVDATDDSLDVSIDLTADAAIDSDDGSDSDVDTDLLLDAGIDVGLDDDDLTIEIGLLGGLGLGL